MEAPVYECRGKEAGLTFPCYAQLKLDGEYNVFAEGKLVNKYGKEKSKLPLTEELETLNAVLVGELYWGEGKSGSLYDLLAHRKSPDLKFGVFDILRYFKQDTKHMSYEKRREMLECLLPKPLPHTHLIPSVLVKDKDTLQMAFVDAVKEGYEGIVAKNSYGTLTCTTTRWVKMKYKETADLRIVKIDHERERIEVRVNDAKVCGVKCIKRFKRMLKVGDIVEIEHQGILNGNGLRHPVYIRPRPDKKEADTL